MDNQTRARVLVDELWLERIPVAMAFVDRLGSLAQANRDRAAFHQKKKADYAAAGTEAPAAGESATA